MPADGTEMDMQVVLELTGRIQGVPVNEMFTADETKNGAIFGMRFLVEHGCVVDFGRPLIKMGKRVIVCNVADETPMRYGSWGSGHTDCCWDRPTRETRGNGGTG